MKKIKAIQLHFKRRSKERVGKSYSKKEQKQIAARIRGCQNASFIRRHSNTRSEWQIFWDGEVLRVIYDKPHHTCVTVLPILPHTKLSPLMEKLLQEHNHE
jgi:hypothetical protein